MLPSRRVIERHKRSPRYLKRGRCSAALSSHARRPSGDRLPPKDSSAACAVTSWSHGIHARSTLRSAASRPTSIGAGGRQGQTSACSSTRRAAHAQLPAWARPFPTRPFGQNTRCTDRASFAEVMRDEVDGGWFWLVGRDGKPLALGTGTATARLRDHRPGRGLPTDPVTEQAR